MEDVQRLDGVVQVQPLAKAEIIQQLANANVNDVRVEFKDGSVRFGALNRKDDEMEDPSTGERIDGQSGVEVNLEPKAERRTSFLGKVRSTISQASGADKRTTKNVVRFCKPKSREDMDIILFEKGGGDDEDANKNANETNNNDPHIKKPDPENMPPIMGFVALFCCGFAIGLSITMSIYWYHWTWFPTTIALIMTLYSMTSTGKNKMNTVISTIALINGLVTVIWSAIEIANCNRYCACLDWDLKVEMYHEIKRRLKAIESEACVFPIFPPIPKSAADVLNMTCLESPIDLTHYAISNDIQVTDCGDTFKIPDVCTAKEWIEARKNYTMDVWENTGQFPEASQETIRRRRFLDELWDDPEDLFFPVPKNVPVEEESCSGDARCQEPDTECVGSPSHKSCLKVNLELGSPCLWDEQCSVAASYSLRCGVPQNCYVLMETVCLDGTCKVVQSCDSSYEASLYSPASSRMLQDCPVNCSCCGNADKGRCQSPTSRCVANKANDYFYCEEEKVVNAEVRF